MAKKHGGWCSDVSDDQLVEHEGKEYCIFHAPAEHPAKEDVKAFNELVFDRIDQAKDKEEECNLNGTVFPGDVSFQHYGKDNPLPQISFNEAAFSGYAYFMEAAFSEDAYFMEAAFSGIAAFLRAAFNGNTNFSKAAFNGDAYFSKAAFSGNAFFREAAFSEDAYFREAAFSGDAYFSKAAFSGNAFFSKAAFSGDAYFSKAAFSGNAAFMQVAFSGDAYFKKTTFSGNAYFVKAAFSGNAYFIEAAFSGDAYFSDAKFNGFAAYNLSRFVENAFFEETIFSNAGFGNSHFEKPALFERTQFRKIGLFNSCFCNTELIFSGAFLYKVSFERAHLESFRFINCKWPKSKGRRVIYDARNYFPITNHDEKEPEKDTKEASGSTNKQPSSLGDLADVFRRLKKIALTEQDQLLASDWHFAEKEMLRQERVKDRSWKNRRGIVNSGWSYALWWYKLLSGYGESPRNAFIVLVVLVLLPLLAYYPFSQLSTPTDYLPFIPMKSGELADPSAGWTIMKGLYRILIIAQAALFGMALRNKLRR